MKQTILVLSMLMLFGCGESGPKDNPDALYQGINKQGRYVIQTPEECEGVSMLAQYLRIYPIVLRGERDFTYGVDSPDGEGMRIYMLTLGDVCFDRILKEAKEHEASEALLENAQPSLPAEQQP